MDYIERSITDKIISRFQQRRVIAITGARQTGKTTLCKNIIPAAIDKPFKYYTFDDPDERIRFKNSAIRILENIKEPVIILDEIQKIPEIFDPLKYLIDKEGQNKKFIITGSSQILLIKGIKETLSGRVFLFNLYPLSFSEVNQRRGKLIFLNKIIEQKGIFKKDIEEISLIPSDKLRYLLNTRDKLLEWGGYPAIWRMDNDDKGIEKIGWLKDYRKTYLERDVPDVGSFTNPEAFILTQKLLALRTGQILSISEIAKEAGVAVNTVKRYIYILGATFLCFLLNPYFNNTSKRLVKSPKIYFPDNGLNRVIAGEDGISRGAEYETWIFSELLKWKELQDIEPEIYFYKSASGLEVDFIIKAKGFILPIEVKSTQKVNYADGRGIESFLKEYKIPLGIIVYQGKEITEIRKNVFAVPDWLLFT
ncbi:MAG: ATP-binding protein [Candidatus Acidulodesulfobacterium ferriphilum]|uniref:ATP-binding protein n=1 Tax=Candidatus Acidulodesulfobacterium ferriphilum TaxID=2597223 RepID=A0A519BAD2_9DELT|nr:MAG: ATP-binding protein [Candidatus Acidulodesulfobacterium ferriphilum]